MIFADKLIELRKRAGMTQEELADKMNVSRQSIAKWEGAQSVPELSKILRLSQIFGVSTDYLLKDELELPDSVSGQTWEDARRNVSMEEANSFLDSRKKAAIPLALATMLCIISPICLIFLVGMTAVTTSGLSGSLAVGAGMSILLTLVAIAVLIFIVVGSRSSQFKYLEKDDIETAYGVSGMVNERRSKFKKKYDLCNAIGTVLCILATVPLFIGIIFSESNGVIMVAMLCLLIAMVSVGVFLFVRVGVVWASFEKLMEEGEYSAEMKKQKRGVAGAILGGYWLVTAAVFLGYSFITKDWNYSWIIFAVAVALYPVVCTFLRAKTKSENK